MLPAIRAALGPDFRCCSMAACAAASDALKALALGAQAVLVGAPQLHALAVGGMAGVAHMLHILRTEFELAMAQCGCTQTSAIGPDLVVPTGSESVFSPVVSPANRAIAPRMTVVTRFAPSPTGKLHVGNIRTALHNWLLAQKHGGRFLLRIDDTDAQRSREEHVEAIRADLAWLGLHPEGEERQSARFAIYEEAFERLIADGRLYRCYETAQELDLKRKILLGRGLPRSTTAPRCR
jgi:hypothetical protein